MPVSRLWSAAFIGVLLVSTGMAQPRRQREPQNSQTKSAPLSAPSAAGSTQGKSSASAGQSSPLDSAVEQIVKREQDEVTAFGLFKPIVETYIQQLKPDKEMGYLPDHDAYYIGQADLGRGVAVRSMLPRGGALGLFSPGSDSPWNPGGFLQMIYVDRDHFDKEHYNFQYAGRDFLGEVRCLMFDLTPTHKSGKGRFKGRIWVEDHNYTIVRFSGVYTQQRLMTHFDSWRLNVQPDMWLPAYVFIEELNPKDVELPRFKAQTHFWAYSPKAASHEDEFSDLVVEGDNKQVQDDSADEHDRSPVQEEREFEREGEDNAIDTLVRAGLIAPEGDVDKVLDTVLNNLEVTNHLDIDPEPRCRVMLTSNIELFSVGHTIVLSRGLLDVLPDEATLAVMLAQELSDAMASKGFINQYGFSDVLQTPSTQALKRFSFKDSREDWEATSAKALEIIGNSPYRSKLGTAALFLQQLNEESKLLPHLIGPHLGNQVYPIAALMNAGPRLEPAKTDQIAALPMGSRVKLDPWDDRIEMMKAASVALLSAREKMPFEVTPFMPYLTRYRQATAASNSTQTGAPGETQSQALTKN
jgi:hypothetical protein